MQSVPWLPEEWGSKKRKKARLSFDPVIGMSQHFASYQIPRFGVESTSEAVNKLLAFCAGLRFG
jgi:hypothetical protein